jgi:hypothetical protein
MKIFIISQVIELRSSDPTARNATAEYLATKNYTIAATFDDGVMFALNDLRPETEPPK